MPLLEVENVVKIYNRNTVGEVKALNNISLSLRAGEFVSIVGSNAAGKTSLFNTIAGSTRPDRGDVRLDGKTILPLKEHEKAVYISRVRQNPNESVIRTMTLAENLSLAKLRILPRGLRKGVKLEWKSEFIELLRPYRLGLEKRLDDKIDLLSGGQKQVVALLMATMTKPKLLLLDEHTAALDPRVSEKVLEITDELIKRERIATLMITHNISHALRYGSRLLLLDRGRVTFDASGEAKKKLTIAAVVEKIEGHAAEFEEDITV